MHRIDLRRPALAATLLLVGLLSGCSDDDPSTAPESLDPEPQLSFVGSDACGYCHTSLFNSFLKTGHPYKLNKVEGGQPPDYPYSDVPSPPTGITWDDVSYVIGGYGWKARFIDQQGYIITEGGKNQFNLATKEWSDYHPDEVKPYDCGGCHTTGYQAEGNQDGLPGLVGTWVLPGIQCEECHGPGSLHANSPTSVGMTIDTRAEECGRCHNRGGVNADIPAKGGFIRHHEQYNELTAGSHKFLDCVTCHDPHTSTKYREQQVTPAIVTGCEDCHSEARASLAAGSLAADKAEMECTSCHMPYLVKNAVASSKYVADIGSHLVRINADSLAEQFNSEGTLANSYLTLEYACLGCHTQAEETKVWAAENASRVHGTEFAGVRKLGLLP